MASSKSAPAAPTAPGAPPADAPSHGEGRPLGVGQSNNAARAGERRIWLALASAATVLPRKIGQVTGGVARRLLGRGRNQKAEQQQQLGGLKDIVSYSSRRMAASRALEFELGEEKALFLDPLAATLAGPGAIADAKKWARACSSAANAIADALAAGKPPPTKQELVDRLLTLQEGAEKGKDKTGSNFTIGAPLTLVALAGRSIHRGRVDGSFSALVPLVPAEHSVSLVNARHRWFDAAMLEALEGEGYGVQVEISSSSSSPSAAREKGGAKDESGPVVRVEISPRGAPSPSGGDGREHDRIEQVVLLGSGMDARAWRLPLKGGNPIAWFDLDSGPVCDIKRRELESAGAELVRNERGEGEGEVSKPPRFPLKPKSYACVGCDMSSGDWVSKLREAGFDSSRPALFAAEGLIYYLGSKAPDFMRSLQSIAAPGSVFLLDALDEAGVATAVRKAEGKGLQGQFKFGIPAQDPDLGDLKRFFAEFGFDRLVAADTWDVLRARFRREAPGRCFTKDKSSSRRVEGGIRFIVVAKGV